MELVIELQAFQLALKPDNCRSRDVATADDSVAASSSVSTRRLLCVGGYASTGGDRKNESTRTRGRVCSSKPWTAHPNLNVDREVQYRGGGRKVYEGWPWNHHSTHNFVDDNV